MNMNPFDLRGPEFLVFYATLATLVFIIVWLIQRFLESGMPGDESAWGAGVAKDPYQVACLRGGRDEVIRVAVVSLVERGLLSVVGDNLQTTTEDAADKVRRPLNKAILTKFANSGKGQSIYSDTIALDEADAVAATLQEKGLLPNGQIAVTRAVTTIAAVALLWGVAGMKIAIALSRGRQNILFLILMACIVGIVAVLLTKRRRTTLGNRTLSYVQEQFAGLNARRESMQLDGRTGEIAFLTAAFGMAALPVALAPIFQPLHLRPLKPDTSGWSWGSGCGSSSCGGGGGGCGGGGCGGCGG